ncbi:hypothetical protein C2845_PM01G40720 [Panicum miliaceum]|uniref:Uncharacterized protein n=1 Tax=Panicum miliaceum TaxID=4540 RepID=A0A3L6TKF5_PANMI|nr:hypothetical protein C2845_PM01G40720 [Panicum miliaceum]
MASPVSAYTGGSGSSRTRSGGRSAAAAAAAKHVLSRLRSTWRRSAAQPRRRAAVSFGYDLRSYSQNFDDDLVDPPAPRPLSVIPCN